MRRALVLVACALVIAGCGGDDGPELRVSAAASLRDAFADYRDTFDAADVKLSLAGSDELAAQIRQGAKPDVFAAASTRLPDELYDEGRVERPVVFAGNRLVLAVPAKGSKVARLEDLEGDVDLAIGAEGVPIGDYTRTVLARLRRERADRILDNVRSAEPDVGGIVGKLTQGAVDAGFVYATDVRGSKGRLRAIDLPASLQPIVAYAIAVVKGAREPEAAGEFIEGLVTGEGAQALRRAGFDPPPPPPEE